MDLIGALGGLPLFRRLSAEQLGLVADLAEAHVVAAGGVLSRQADLGEHLFLLASGEAVIHRVDEAGLRRPVGMLSAGMAYGVTSLWIDAPRDATVTAVTACRVWTIGREPFHALLASRPALARALDLPEEVAQVLDAPDFPWLEPGETVTLYTHRHSLSYVAAVLGWSVAVAVYGVLLAALPRVTEWSPNAVVWGAPAALVYGLALAWHWIDWHNDYLAVTNRRVAHRERVALLYESRYEAPLDRVQNINVRRGLLGAILDYGDLSVETAAKVGRLHVERIPHPERAREAIFSQQARMRATQRAAERARIQEALAGRIASERADLPPPPEPLFHERPAEGKVEGDDALTVAEPGALLRVVGWLARTGILPATRMATAEGVVWRRHWIHLLGAVARPLVLAFLCGGLAAFGVRGLPARIVALTPAYPLIMGALAVGGLAWAWWEANDWSNDLYAVTDERIVDIEKRPLFFAEHRREATLGVIQNVSFEMPTFWAAVFDYGDVLVQTAGSGEFTFLQVPGPREVQAEIFRRMEAYRERQRRLEAEGRRHEFAEWLAAYDEIRAPEGGGGRNAMGARSGAGSRE